MKRILYFILISVLLVSGSGCQNKRSRKEPEKSQPDTSAIADTGFTGIKKYYSGIYLVKEVTFSKGIRQGLMKTYYKSGKLYQTFWYESGILEDTARWYFEDGRIFRETPYKNDTVNGTQIQYYKTGKVRAKLGFAGGSRTPFFEEFSQDGRKITDYPEVLVTIKNDYKLDGTFKISLELSKKNVKVNFYKGEFIGGLFLPKKYVKLNTNDFKGYLRLTKSGTPGANYIGIIAEISTDLGNKYLTYKKIDLPFNDLK
jgi:antitoxin component YwqK of YwqJK toxin-antitoxin module